jgi:hypothetical protein
MKANKARKRLAKIEALISDVAKRYSPTTADVKEALENAATAIGRAIQAVNTASTSGKSKRDSAADFAQPSQAATKSSMPIGKPAPGGRKVVTATARRVGKSAVAKRKASISEHSRKAAAKVSPPVRAAKVPARKKPPTLVRTAAATSGQVVPEVPAQ